MSRQWSSGIYEVLHIATLGSCALATCCFPCGNSVVYGMLTKKQGGNFWMGLSAHFLCPIAIWYMGGRQRRSIRQKYGLPEKPCNDYMVHLVRAHGGPHASVCCS
jgi:Cys-rich protein (TIGR01571 family)